MMRIKVLAVAICALYSTCTAYPSPQPMIGVFLQEVENKTLCAGQYSFAAYKTYIEQGGGGVVPIFVNQSDEYYERLIPRLNGVFLPGGDIGQIVTSPFGVAASKVKKLAMKMNDAGTHYPIWGTCQGFEDMATWPTGTSVLTSCVGAEGVSLPVDFTPAAKTSTLYGPMSVNMRNTMANKNVTANNHNQCLSMQTFSNTEELKQFYTVLSTNMDGNGLEYVSTIEAKNYPFYGVQFHPEKSNLEHMVGTSYNQSPEAIEVGQYFANFLVSEAKKNSNSFKSLEEEGRFIINQYGTRYDMKVFMEMYCISPSTIPPFDK